MNNNLAFEILLEYLGLDIYAENTMLFLASAGAALALSLLLRILAGLAYYSNISALMIFAKPVEKKSDIKKTPSKLINRCVSEYMFCGENGAPLSAVDSIVMKNILKMNFLGISLKAIEKFSVWLDGGALGIGAVAVLTSGKAGWLPLVGGAFIICRVPVLYFDTRILCDKLFYGITTYLNRELGKFYIPDDKAGMRVFKAELHSSLMEQASILQNAINNLNAGLSSIVKDSYSAIQNSLEEKTKEYDGLAEKLAVPVEGMGNIFTKLEASVSTLKDSSEVLADNIALTDKKLGQITEALEKSNAATAKSIGNVETVFTELRDGLKAFNGAYTAVEKELSNLESNQKALEASLQSYELSLQQTTGQVGDAIGSIIEYQGKEASIILNEAIAAHVKQFQSDTANLIDKMTALFELSYEQNKSEMQTLLRIEEIIEKR